MRGRWSCVIAAVALASVFSAAQQSASVGAGASPSAPKSETSLPQRVRISQGVAQSLLIKKVAPKYPKDARKAHIQGSVALKALIDKNGEVADLTLVYGDPALVPAAIEAVKQWKYKPYLLNGQPVNAETQIVLHFELSDH